MDLAERDKERIQFLDKQIKTVNLDMSILNGISGKNVSTEATAVQKPPKLTINQLAQVLKNKNDKTTHLQSQKNQVKEWLKDKGVNLKKINQQINQSARVSAELGIFLEPKQSQIKYMGISGIRKQPIGLAPQKQTLEAFTEEFQSNFINKQKQVSLNREIIKSMRQSTKKNNFRSILINKIKQTLTVSEAANKSGIQQQQLQNKTILSLSREEEIIKDESRKNQYFNFVSSLAMNGFNESIKKLKQIRPFWKIVLEHLKTIQHYAPILEESKLQIPGLSDKDTIQLKLNACMMYKSLKMIEREFQKELPGTTHSYEKLDEIIKNMEKRNRKLKVWRNSNGEPSWGRAYMLLRAGRIDEVKRVLRGVDQEFLDDLLSHEQSLAKTPTPSYMRHESSRYRDSFYTQLLYILQANQQFEPQIIMDEDILTKTWILLRTMGIYRCNPDIEQSYQIIGNSIADVESKGLASFNSATVEKFLHLGLYRNLIYLLEMILDQQIEKQIDGITYDDYFHLLMVVSIYPELWGNTSQKQKVGLEAKFIKQLGQYMIKLRHEGFKEKTAKYLILCPVNKLSQVASKLITTRQEYKEFDWHSFKQTLRLRHPQQGDSIYLHVSKYVLDQLELKTFKDLMYAAELYKSTFANLKDSLYLEQKCYVKLLLKHLFFVEKKRYLIKKQLLGPEFTCEMFAFFEIGPEEARDQVILREIDEDVKAHVNQCQIFLGRHVDFDSKNQLYTKNILQPYLFYQTVNQLANLLQKPISKLFELQRFDNSLMYKNLKQPVSRIEHNLNLLQFFRSEFNNQITSLYVFYLTMLVQRKKILSSKQCDYSGLPAYVEGLLTNLKTMDRACEARVEKIDLIKFSNEQERKQIIEASMNQLQICPEFIEFREEMQDYLRQYGGIYGMGLQRINNHKLPKNNTGIIV